MTGTALVYVPRRQGDTYDRDVADAMLELVKAGLSVGQASRVHGMPPVGTMWGWIYDDIDGLAERYARAEQIRIEALGDRMMDVACTTQIGQRVKVLPNGTVEIQTGDMIEHRKLQVDVLKWIMCKLGRRRYGDPREAPQADAGPQELRIVVDGGLPDVDRTPKAP